MTFVPLDAMLTKIMHKEELEEREVLLPHGLTERRSTRKT